MASALGVVATSYSSEDVSELIKQIKLQAGRKAGITHMYTGVYILVKSHNSHRRTTWLELKPVPVP